jgi:hypothetical protein
MAGDVTVSAYLEEAQVAAALRHATAPAAAISLRGIWAPNAGSDGVWMPGGLFRDSSVHGGGRPVGGIAADDGCGCVVAGDGAMCEDAAWLERLRATGRVRARDCSWESAASLHAEVLSDTIDKDP